MQLFDMTQPEALGGCENRKKMAHFPVCKIKVGNLGVMHKTRFEGDHQKLSFCAMLVVDAMQPVGANVSIRFFWINGPPI